MNVEKMHKEFDEQIGKLNGNYQGNYLLGIVPFRQPPQTNKKGLSNELERELEDWQRQGGGGFVQYSIPDNFKKGILTLSPIQQQMKFIVYDKGYQKIISKKDKKELIGIYMEALIK